MKTKLFLISILIIISTIEINDQEFKFGFLAGLDITKTHFVREYDIPGEKDHDPMVSFNVNGYVGFKSPGFWGFSIEPGFIEKSGIFQNNYVYPPLRGRSEDYYIQMPVLADFYLLNKFFLSIGPEFAIWLNSSSEGKKFELSGLAGVNYQIMKKVDLGLRYSHALTYAFKELGIYQSGYKRYNQYLQFIIRYKY